MSGATYSPIPIKQRLLRDQRRAKIIALAGVTAFSAMLVALVLVLDGGDPPTTATDRPAGPAQRADHHAGAGARRPLRRRPRGGQPRPVDHVQQRLFERPALPGRPLRRRPRRGQRRRLAIPWKVSEGQAFPGLAEQAEGAR